VGSVSSAKAQSLFWLLVVGAFPVWMAVDGHAHLVPLSRTPLIVVALLALGLALATFKFPHRALAGIDIAFCLAVAVVAGIKASATHSGLDLAMSCIDAIGAAQGATLLRTLLRAKRDGAS
jgi:hypothetical protein